MYKSESREVSQRFIILDLAKQINYHFMIANFVGIYFVKLSHRKNVSLSASKTQPVSSWCVFTNVFKSENSMEKKR